MYSEGRSVSLWETPAGDRCGQVYPSGKNDAGLSPSAPAFSFFLIAVSFDLCHVSMIPFLRTPNIFTPLRTGWPRSLADSTNPNSRFSSDNIRTSIAKRDNGLRFRMRTCRRSARTQLKFWNVARQ